MFSVKCVHITSLVRHGRSTPTVSISRALASIFVEQRQRMTGSDVMQTRFTSTLPESVSEFHDDEVVSYATTTFSRSSVVDQTEEANFPGSKPVLLNAKVHAVGYLSKILNARVYEAAIETELQFATNLSAVSNNHHSYRIRVNN